MANNNILFFSNPQIIFKRFAGDGFKQGRPTFGIRLTDDLAKQLEEAGWPVSSYVPKTDPTREPELFLKVPIYWYGEGDNLTPKIVSTDTFTGKKMPYLPNTVHRLDRIDMKNVEVEIQRYWNDKYSNPGWCIKLLRMHFDIETTEFDRKMDLGDDWEVDNADTL